MMTCAGAELAWRGRGPPPVPRRISLVLAACPALACANQNPPMEMLLVARKVLRSMTAFSSPSRDRRLRADQRTRQRTRHPGIVAQQSPVGEDASALGQLAQPLEEEWRDAAPPEAGARGAR